MTELRNCPICYKLFAFDGELALCPECDAKDEQDLMKLRAYIRDNPGVTPSEAAKGTRVNEEVILRLLRRGRLRSG